MNSEETFAVCKPIRGFISPSFVDIIHKHALQIQIPVPQGNSDLTDIAE